MKFKNTMKNIWEFPQNIVGLIVRKIYNATPYTTYKDAIVYSWDNSGGISLGRHICVPFKNEDPESFMVQQYIKHEYGHTIQSSYLGWFYLLIIGIPSIIWAGCFEWYRKKTGMNYNDFYTEQSADFLGGVER